MNSKALDWGLRFAQRLVELHKGTVEVESVPHQQTIVRVTLPSGD
jgi:signal transduction histidine kinase